MAAKLLEPPIRVRANRCDNSGERMIERRTNDRASIMEEFDFRSRG